MYWTIAQKRKSCEGNRAKARLSEQLRRTKVRLTAVSEGERLGAGRGATDTWEDIRARLCRKLCRKNSLHRRQ